MTERLYGLTDDQASACIRCFGDDCNCWTLLASAPDLELQMWAIRVFPDVIDRRGNTIRCRVFFGGSFGLEDALSDAVEAAREHDVTIQALCVFEPLEETKQTHSLPGGATCTVRECREEYPVLVLGSHEMRWPPT